MNQPPQATALLNHCFTAMLTADSYGCIQWANMASEQLLNMGATRILKISIFNLLQPIETEAPQKESNREDTIEEQFAKSEQSFQPFISHDRWIKGIKQPLFVDYSVTPILINGDIQFLVEIWSKERQHRISQEQLNQHQYGMARKMLRAVAHEVKNPLAGIRGAAQLLVRQLNKLQIDDSKIKEKVDTYSDIIISETDRLNLLIKDLLGAQQLPQWQPLNIHIPLEHVLTLAHTQYPELHIVRDYDLSLPEISADKNQLIQVFLNLTTNAIEAMTQQQANLQIASQDGAILTEVADIEATKIEATNKEIANNYQPTLTIKTRVEFQYTVGLIENKAITHKQVAKISIIDNGTGIDAELINEVFFPLVTGRADGTGLGLSLVQDIIQRHQGHIEVESSTGENSHTCFNIYLPFKHI